MTGLFDEIEVLGISELERVEFGLACCDIPEWMVTSLASVGGSLILVMSFEPVSSSDSGFGSSCVVVGLLSFISLSSFSGSSVICSSRVSTSACSSSCVFSSPSGQGECNYLIWSIETFIAFT